MKIKVGDELSLGLIDMNGKEVFKDFSKPTIISTFPKLNTTICDQQTMWMGEQAAEYLHVDFLSITLDKVDVIKEWCFANSLENIDIASDKELKDFSLKTGLTFGVGPLKVLERGFIFLDKGKIEGIKYNRVDKDPNYKAAEEWINSK